MDEDDADIREIENNIVFEIMMINSDITDSKYTTKTLATPVYFPTSSRYMQILERTNKCPHTQSDIIWRKRSGPLQLSAS